MDLAHLVDWRTAGRHIAIGCCHPQYIGWMDPSVRFADQSYVGGREQRDVAEGRD